MMMFEGVGAYGTGDSSTDGSYGSFTKFMAKNATLLLFFQRVNELFLSLPCDLSFLSSTVHSF